MTIRKEDKAYCPLGIFDVYIPLIYGEDFNASIRLGEAIEHRSKRIGMSFSWIIYRKHYSTTLILGQVITTLGYLDRRVAHSNLAESP